MQKKIASIQKQSLTAQLNLDQGMGEIEDSVVSKTTKDTLRIVGDDGSEVFIMKAIRDEESGEMVATEEIDAAVVTARFRNVSEHNGRIDLSFLVTVPASMQDGKWQLRMSPDMFILGDSVRLETVLITGKDYRRKQLRGYQLYQRFVSRIVSDTTTFIDRSRLEIFIERNMRQLYSYKQDTTFISDEEFYQQIGVSEQQVREHYTNRLFQRLNDWLRSQTDRVYRMYVKSPILTEGIRLDTVVVNGNGDFTYNYVQTINTRPRLKKVDIVLSGGIWEQDKKIYTMPRTEPLTFYISSISAFAQDITRYKTKVIERRVEANTECFIEFEAKKSAVDLKLANNLSEINRIKGYLSDLMQDANYDLDSIVVSASASPDGRVFVNEYFSKMRSQSISEYFNSYIKSFQDSLSRDSGLMIDENGNILHYEPKEISFVNYSNGENWDMLDYLVVRDTVLTEGQKSRYSELSRVKNLDDRERLMKKESSFDYIHSTLYPRLRTVKFNFFLHRKGMVKDTVHTTVIDSVYITGVQALKDMDYDLAIKFLQPYKDINTAVAYVATGRNKTALSILEPLERTPEVNYLLAVLYSRDGRMQEAVQCYLNACNENSSYVFRGNLDPEISALIRTYGLNQEEEDEFAGY